ncbi:MAG: hypothetical protein CMN55_00115 [Sneathiella sp.]|jgi:hypothetical protein|uniref:hypothetical protein n=1 Tax=Sneathiella sp. TaxID=1964365 RepID=UPI000C62BB5F|nr:hypothetical protein [Sneathiella sp.]MAL77518.1 hypothetical protein [Sneathiella sp.]|tara:strand:+ start:649 stop:1563 length:915 start_codon:yes stop_codon:yes gene_type:complete
MSEEQTTGGLGGGIPEEVAPETTTAPSSLDFTSEETYGQFLQSLPEELQSNDTLRNTKSVHSLADQLVNAQSALGSKRLAAPQEDWGEEQWEDFYDNVRPADAEYTIPDEVIVGEESVPVDLPDETLQEFVDFTAELGLSQNQFDQLYEAYVGMGIEQQQLADEAIEKQVEDARTSVRMDWGDNYEVNLAQANQAYEAMASEIPEIKELVESDPVVANHPAVLKLFHRLAEVSGDTLPPATNNPASGFANQNTHGVKAQIAELDTDHASLIMSDPGSLNLADRAKRQEILNRRANLYANLYGQG